MGRSVMTAADAVAIVYFTGDYHYRDESDWSDEVDSVRGVIKQHYPSFEDIDLWHGPEVHCILSNELAHVTISVYCGCVAVCLVAGPVDYDREGLAEAWCQRVAGLWCDRLNKAFNGMRKIGTGSNGIAFYERIG